MRWLFIPSCLALLLAAGPAAAICEIHPNYDSEFRKSLNAALYRVRSTEHLAAIIYRLILIDQEVEAHEMAHFNTAEGWAEAPVYETVELYDLLQDPMERADQASRLPAQVRVLDASLERWEVEFSRRQR